MKPRAYTIDKVKTKVFTSSEGEELEKDDVIGVIGFGKKLTKSTFYVSIPKEWHNKKVRSILVSD